MGNGLLTEPILVPAPTANADQLVRSDHGQATRFLQRSTFGARPGDVDHLQRIGLPAWFDEQVEMDPRPGHVDMLLNDSAERLQTTVWRAFLGSEAQLRRRVGYALSQILVVSDQSVGADAVAAYADLLNAGAFGNFRDLLESVALSPAMGHYLSHNRNAKENPKTGTMPDENFAREVMQLFTIGLWELNIDGSRKTVNNEPIPTYDNQDVMGLARVFTGWENPVQDNERWLEKPMRPWEPSSRWHESGAKELLGIRIPEGTGPVDSVRRALDRLFLHSNTAPFISHQLIQRLVTSNPSRYYVRRVAEVFENDGAGVRGNLRAVIEAVLTDVEALEASPPDYFGKIREPVLRFAAVLRAIDVSSTTSQWLISDLSHPATAIGQQPFVAPSVFNFYRPGFSPPKSDFATRGMVCPEMQIANESSAVGWINRLALIFKRPPAGLTYDLKALSALSGNVDALIDEVEKRLCPGRLSATTRLLAKRTLEKINHTNASLRQQERSLAAVLLVAASTDFIYER